ncbi:MAG: hypothetical protein L0228_07720 [Planctomycetes bacterium]|nr:hypothetical protein [Planctomycetota bacterium]
MGNRIFVGVVVLLWMGSMSWLMVARILPPFFNGEPPGHGVLLRNEPVCWDIEYDGQLVGHAVSKAVPGALGTTEIHSRVLLEGLEVRKLAPQWMSTLVRGLGQISLDMRTRIVLDSLNSLSSFETRVRLNDLPLVMKVTGRVDGPDLLLKVKSGDVTHTVRYPVPHNSLLASELIPQPKLLQVYVGRKWQQEVYSPFRPPSDSLEVLQAEVVEERWFDRRGERTRARKIEYRAMSPAGVAADNTLRAVVWVGDDGTVLRQDLHLMETKLRFERRDESHMLRLAEELLDLENVATIATPPESP